MAYIGHWRCLVDGEGSLVKFGISSPTRLKEINDCDNIYKQRSKELLGKWNKKAIALAKMLRQRNKSRSKLVDEGSL